MKDDSIFLSGPKSQDGVLYCCQCDPDIQRPHQGITKGVFGEEIIIKQKQWCLHCGLVLTQQDTDKFFPRDQWTDNR